MDRGHPTDSEYIFPCLRKFWAVGSVTVSKPKSYTAIRQVLFSLIYCQLFCVTVSKKTTTDILLLLNFQSHVYVCTKFVSHVRA